MFICISKGRKFLEISYQINAVFMSYINSCIKCNLIVKSLILFLQYLSDR